MKFNFQWNTPTVHGLTKHSIIHGTYVIRFGEWGDVGPVDLTVYREEHSGEIHLTDESLHKLSPFHQFDWQMIRRAPDILRYCLNPNWKWRECKFGTSDKNIVEIFQYAVRDYYLHMDMKRKLKFGGANAMLGLAGLYAMRDSPRFFRRRSSPIVINHNYYRKKKSKAKKGKSKKGKKSKSKKK